jgi:pheromone shutdown protein TraB
MLELCKSRINILHLDEETVIAESQKMNTSRMLELMREKGNLQGALYILLLSMSAHITKELGMAPGGEFRSAFVESQRIPGGCLVHLGDRPIDVTLKRALHSLSLWQKIRLAFNLLASKDSITKEDVEKCKEKDMLESMLEEMAGRCCRD